MAAGPGGAVYEGGEANLKAYLNYHLGVQADGTFAEGNDPDSYLKHIQAKAPWVQYSTTPQEIKNRGAVEDLLNGFMNAEGIVEGTVLSRAPRSARA